MTSILGGPSAAAGLIAASTSEALVEAIPGNDVPGPEAPTFLATADEPLAEPVDDGGRRLVVRLLGGDDLELGAFEERGDAVEAAQELVSRFTTAEASGDWPEVDGRFLRPAAIVSIDVLAQR